MRRAIQRLIEDPLSEEVLLGKFVANDTVRVELDEDNKVIFRKGAPLGLDEGFEAPLNGDISATLEA